MTNRTKMVMLFLILFQFCNCNNEKEAKPIQGFLLPIKEEISKIETYNKISTDIEKYEINNGDTTIVYFLDKDHSEILSMGWRLKIPKDDSSVFSSMLLERDIALLGTHKDVNIFRFEQNYLWYSSGYNFLLSFSLRREKDFFIFYASHTFPRYQAIGGIKTEPNIDWEIGGELEFIENEDSAAD